MLVHPQALLLLGMVKALRPTFPLAVVRLLYGLMTITVDRLDLKDLWVVALLRFGMVQLLPQKLCTPRRKVPPLPEPTEIPLLAAHRLALPFPTQVV